jgi:hydrogenase maturation protease
MKTIVLGLGNPLFGDDGLGCRVAQGLRNKISQADITVQEFAGAGLDVLDLVSGYDKVIIIDAIHSGGGDVGTVYHLGIDQISTPGTVPLHQMDFIGAFKLGHQAGLTIPKDISIYAVEAGVTERLMDECSPAVSKAIPICIDLIIKELKTN